MSEALTDVIGGRVQTVFLGVAAGLPAVRSGRVILLAVTGDKRQAVLPDVPTFQELGYPSMQALTWYGVVGPAKMPQAVTDKLNATINDILKSPDFQQKLAQLGIDPMPMSLATVRRLHRQGSTDLDAGRPRQQHQHRLTPQRVIPWITTGTRMSQASKNPEVSISQRLARGIPAARPHEAAGARATPAGGWCWISPASCIAAREQPYVARGAGLRRCGGAVHGTGPWHASWAWKARPS